MRFFLFARNAQCLHENKPDNAQNNRNRKDDGIAESFVKEHSCHGAGCKSEVHADAKIADAFATAACWQCVNGDRIACRCRNSKEKSVGKSHHRKNGQKPDDLVADKADRERKERPEVQRLTAERIDKKPREGAASKCSNCIKRNDDASSRVVGGKLVNNVQRKNR